MLETNPPRRTLLEDLESRQDELLRLLGELEARTLQVLNELGAAPAASLGAPPAPASSTTPASKRPAVNLRRPPTESPRSDREAA